MFTPPLQPGQTLSNAEIMAIFHCACEGGIRPSNYTDSIVVVVNHVKNPARENWHDATLWFQGSGSKGDQVLNKGRNRTLNTAFATGRPVYLFEVYAQGKYTFRGRVELDGEPFQRKEKDMEGNDRRVWIFPLMIAAGQPEK